MKEKVLAILGLILMILIVVCAGDLDHDKYIEANSTLITKIP